MSDFQFHVSIEPKLPEGVSATLKWLAGQRDVTDNVIANWSETAGHRSKELQTGRALCNTNIRRNGKCHVTSYMVTYPFLCQSKGYSLVKYQSIYALYLIMWDLCGIYSIFLSTCFCFETRSKNS